jgi:hypothetical protein
MDKTECLFLWIVLSSPNKLITNLKLQNDGSRKKLINATSYIKNVYWGWGVRRMMEGVN